MRHPQRATLAISLLFSFLALSILVGAGTSGATSLGPDGAATHTGCDVRKCPTPTATATGGGDQRAPSSIFVLPETQNASVGSNASLTATVFDQFGDTISGVNVTFIVSGTNSGFTIVSNDPSGDAAFSYAGSNEGNDQVLAFVDQDNDGAADFTEPKDTATVAWFPPIAGCEADPGATCGTNGDDVITGTEGDDVIYAGDGNDVINGLGGNDTIFAGEGDDTVNCGDGDDVVEAGGGNDTVNCGNGDDTVQGGDGDDELFGDSDPTDATFSSRSRSSQGALGGRDHLFGGLGNDSLFGGADVDELEGGDGKDLLNGQGGRDRVRGGRGADIPHGNGGDDEVSGGDGNDKVWGDKGADLIEGNDGDDEMYGGEGDDTCIQGRGDGPVHSCESLTKRHR